METALFIVTLVFVAYVVYVMVTDPSRKASQTQSKSAEATPTAAAQESVSKPVEAEKAAAPQARKPAAPKPQKPAQTASAKAPTAEAAAPSRLRNPSTGEEVNVPTNYRFAKRWIKEAMVSEGLLDKIYKPSELDGDAGEKVKKALEDFKALAKYHA